MFESGTAHVVVFHKSQDIKFASVEMLCLSMQDVNWFCLFAEGKVVMLNCFVLIEACFWRDLCSSYFHTFDHLRKVFRNLCQAILHLSCWFLLCFRNAKKPFGLIPHFEKLRKLGHRKRPP